MNKEKAGAIVFLAVLLLLLGFFFWRTRGMTESKIAHLEQSASEREASSKKVGSGMRYFPETQVYVFEAPTHPEMTTSILLDLPAFRRAVQDAAERRDLIKLLARPAEKEPLAKSLAFMLGLQGHEPEILRCYENALAQINKHTTAEMVSAQRIYIYDAAKVKQDLRSGQEYPYLSYNRESDEVVFNWSLLEALQKGEDLDIPLVFPIPDDHALSREEWVNESFNQRLLPMFKSILDGANGLLSYKFFDLAVEEVLHTDTAELPAWFSVGLRHYVVLAIMHGMSGDETTLAAFDALFPRPSSAPSEESLHLENWVPGKNDKLVEGLYTAASVQIFKQTSNKQGSNDWIPRLLIRLRAEKDKKHLDPTIFNRIFREEIGQDAVDMLHPLVDIR